MNNTHMIFGAPGCGKTTYLIDLLGNLLTTYEPDKIAFVSFTKKGSYEGRDKAIQKFRFKEKDFPFFRTIHSIAFRDLGMSKYEMISKKDYRVFSKAMGMNFVGYYTEDFVNNDDKYLFWCSLYENNPEYSKYILKDLIHHKASNIRKNYQRYKKEMGIRDFDDLLIEFINKNKPLPIDVAIIDEAQDLTTLQWKFCRVAFKNCKKIFVAGDDDQAIYEWNGADVKHFLGLTKTSSVTILDKSYRLRKNVLDFSKKISSKITNRVEKVFDPISAGGNIHFHNTLEEIPINNEQSYYFLSRNNYFLRKYKEHLMKLGLLFYNKDKFSVNKNVYKAIKEYEYLRRKGEKIKESDLKITNYLRKDRKLNAPWYDAFNLSIEESLYYRDLFKNKVNIDECNIRVSTIHGVKGGEADNVVLCLDLTKSVYHNLESNMDSELRCLYVALTRTKKNLHIIYPNSKFGYDDIIRSVI